VESFVLLAGKHVFPMIEVQKLSQDLGERQNGPILVIPAKAGIQ